MRVKALQSFIGRVCMNIDDEREILDKELAQDLINAGHVIEIKAKKINSKVEEIKSKSVKKSQKSK